MSGPMHPCPVAGCGRRCSAQFLMCRSDWWRVPPALQADVYATHSAYQAASRARTPERLREARDAYHNAREQAIHAAEDSRTRALTRSTP